ncbi:MAG: hypothetical protein KatS3mg110_4315 [Pirellulaceae bacterium]|nr:MAG: hypothetical protein KatS3mg110_4315 [Pirellulaceae bacterium]
MPFLLRVAAEVSVPIVRMRPAQLPATAGMPMCPRYALNAGRSSSMATAGNRLHCRYDRIRAARRWERRSRARDL